MSYYNIIIKLKQTNKITIKSGLISFLISKRISPYFSAFYIKKKVAPNTITIHMIISGIIGAIFFSFSNIYFKIVGAIFMQLWLILDYSDGEVARETNNFSKYGKELDYTAHIINHPLFSISLLLSMIEIRKYNNILLITIFFLTTCLDLYFRNICAFYFIETLKEKQSENKNLKKYKKNYSKIKEKIKRIIEIFTFYPNFILFSTLLYFFNTDIIIFYALLNILFTFIVLVRESLMWINRIK
ncbi:CDP-alcohol phosphatidyltransferase family protein [Fusobacterium varium]|uniref:CDP-alcohol phosphatidyltransferase family protein n=1 Tax=Fusobacterium varium TaxID=856 RepID=UPI00243237F1|nr:CDP-alcohol phosphatidyltransferase family protein [Fusobacterium varium]MCF0170578.1 CDP-alcohol phosphatidyltransferase family protein [Fusobacterium varium]